jgi:hypothetical protein
VRLHNRLAKLEQQVTARCHRNQPGEGSVFERMERWKAYLRREGPKPEPVPCPPWMDPAQWDSRHRIADYLGTGKPPRGLTDEEKAYVDGLLQGFDQWYAVPSEMCRETSHPLESPGA